MPIVLASTSIYRRKLLERLRVPFETRDPGIDEEVFKKRGLPPRVLAQTLAEAKARAVASQVSADTIVLGSDQLLAFEVVLARVGQTDDHEFVAADAGDKIILAHVLPEHLGRMHQHRDDRSMSMGTAMTAHEVRPVSQKTSTGLSSGSRK